LAVGASKVSGAAGLGVQPPLAIGFILMVMIYMGGHISGAHYNPAVTFGVVLRGHMEITKALLYWVAQLCGGISAALMAWAVTDADVDLAPGTNYHTGSAFLVEVAYTFALVSVVLNVATTKAQHNNMFFGIAIGFTVSSGAYSVGGVSGACFNPAVGTGVLIAHTAAGGSPTYLWLYWIAPLLGAALAALVFRITNLKEFEHGVDNPQRAGFRRLDEEMGSNSGPPNGADGGEK
jgi:aquaporin Z